MVRHYQVVLEWDPEDELWVTYVPALDHLSTYGETREHALEHTREAIMGYLEAAEQEGILVAGERSVELVELDVAV